MNRFRVKICGLTRPRDAALATKLGTDMVGMIFHPGSPRFVSQRKAGEIVKEIPPTVFRVGVFVDRPITDVLRIVEKLNLDFVQLHGSESERQVARYQKEGYRVIRAFHPQGKTDYDRIDRSKADLRLIDNRTTVLLGGTGKTFDWGVRPGRKIERLVLAGGINPENLAEGVMLFSPAVVDISSGVERRPGIKSPTRMKAFFKEADRIRYGS